MSRKVSLVNGQTDRLALSYGKRVILWLEIQRERPAFRVPL
jgi:hypothetical protein